MTITIDKPVGLRNGTGRVASTKADQTRIIGLLRQISASDGGQKENWSDNQQPGKDGDCPQWLAGAIGKFQDAWVKRKVLRVVDSVVDPGGNTLKQMNSLAVSSGGFELPTLRVEADNPKPLVQSIHMPVIPPYSSRGKLYESSAEASMQLFRYRVQKRDSVFWVGVGIPKATTDFSKAQIYFHPTVVQGEIVHATEKDYRLFAGGWSGSIERYVAMQGVQMAAAGRYMPLIVPFSTQSSLSNGKSNMFSDGGEGTLNAIMAAVQMDLGWTGGPRKLERIGVSSFSSGISHLRLFIRNLASSGLIKEVNDFDSPWITAEPKAFTRCAGAVSRVFTQVRPPFPSPWWVQLTSEMLSEVQTYKKDGLHAQIGWMTYYSAMLTSAV